MRLFAGWPLPDALRRDLGTILPALRADLPAASWPRPQTLHLTLAFFGETAPSFLDPLRAELRSLVEESRVNARIFRCGFFPGERRPRVAWLGLEPEETIARIAERVRVVSRRAGVEADPRPFRAHLTLARIKAPWDAGARARFAEELRPLEGTAVTVDRVVLFESRPAGGGVEHLPLEIVALA